MFSKSCEYGIRAAIHVASKLASSGRIGLREIAKEVDTPESFTAKVLQQLTKANIISSIKGPNGGFYIDEDQRSAVRLIDIVDAIDGDKIFNGCGLGLKACNANKPCPLHDHFVQVRDDLKQMLEQTTLEGLMTDLNKGKTFLKR